MITKSKKKMESKHQSDVIKSLWQFAGLEQQSVSLLQRRKRYRQCSRWWLRQIDLGRIRKSTAKLYSHWKRWSFSPWGSSQGHTLQKLRERFLHIHIQRMCRLIKKRTAAVSVQFCKFCSVQNLLEGNTYDSRSFDTIKIKVHPGNPTVKIHS